MGHPHLSHASLLRLRSFFERPKSGQYLPEVGTWTRHQNGKHPKSETCSNNARPTHFIMLALAQESVARLVLESHRWGLGWHPQQSPPPCRGCPMGQGVSAQPGASCGRVVSSTRVVICLSCGFSSGRYSPNRPVSLHARNPPPTWPNLRRV